MPRRTVLAFATLLVACSGGALVPDDPPRLASPSAVIPPAAVSATLVFPGAASVSAPVASGPGLPFGSGKVGVVLRDSAPVLSNTGLPDVVVRRIVRQNFGRIRLCYETAAMADPTLSGTVAVLFRIDTSGAVSSARDGGSTVGSPDLIACVLRTFKLLSFPSPTPGPVEVTETLYFTPRSP